MKTESKAEQIKRLQGNMLRTCRMSQSDKNFLATIPSDQLVYLGWSTGTWDSGLSNTDFTPDGIYRIHRSYKLAPDTPEFPGYVLCEVKPDSRGWLKFYLPNGTEHWTLDMAPRFGCCGYVPKEKIRNEYIMLSSPICYIDSSLFTWSLVMDPDYKPATLGWVCFKEEVK